MGRFIARFFCNDATLPNLKTITRNYIMTRGLMLVSENSEFQVIVFLSLPRKR